MSLPEKQPESSRSLDQRAERAWKWMLRGMGLAAFGYVLVVMHGNVPLGAWILIGGLIGLPNALPLEQVVQAWKGTGS
jgi:hypothetical protein